MTWSWVALVNGAALSLHAGPIGTVLGLIFPVSDLHEVVSDTECT